MQFNQPLCYQSDAQFSPCTAQLRYPDVIGEGDVISLRLPDGCVQFYFVPIIRRDRWTPYCPNPYYISNNLPTWSNNSEAWFVRSFLNTYGASGPNLMACNGSPFSRSYDNVNFNQNNGFIQKFHNDCWTSTTDLDYFYPNFRRDWPRGCAAIQVEIPKEEKSIFHYGSICNRPCHCNKNVDVAKPDCNVTPMCVDEKKSSDSCCDGSRKKSKTRSKNSHHSCACPSRCKDKSDKAVTTCTDRGVSCTDIGGCGCLTGLGRRDIETEVWYPRKRKPKKNTRSSNNTEATCGSAICLGSACSDSDSSIARK